MLNYFKVLLAPGFLALSIAANADIIYDTYGAGDAYDSGTAWSVAGYQSIATAFTVGSAMDLGSVKLSLMPNTDYTISLKIGGSAAPGATFTSWSVLGGGDVTLTPSTPVSLAPGSYYIVAESSGDGSGGWYWNNVGHTAPFSYTNGGNWYSSPGTTSVMRIESVPEPMTMLALGAGVLALVRRRKSA